MTRDELLEAAIDMCRGELRTHLMAFKETPIGQVVSRAGRRYLEAKQQGRNIDENDIVQFVQEICNANMGESKDA